MEQEICPKCIGAKEVMVPKKPRGFEYASCSLCSGTGIVTPELSEDYVLSLNEDVLNINND
jgi:hypothetical protein